MKLRCLCHISLLIIVVDRVNFLLFSLSSLLPFSFLFISSLFFFLVDRSWRKNQPQSPPEFNQYCVLAYGSWPFCPHEHRFVNARDYFRLNSVNPIYQHRLKLLFVTNNHANRNINEQLSNKHNLLTTLKEKSASFSSRCQVVLLKLGKVGDSFTRNNRGFLHTNAVLPDVYIKFHSKE